MHVDAAEAILLELPLREPFVAAHGTTRARTLAVVRLATDRGDGWGECAALPAATYTTESATGCFRVLADEMLPSLVGKSVEPSRPDQPFLADLDQRFSSAPMARAAAEMAVLDAWLRANGKPLAFWLGATRNRVPAGVAIGLDNPAALVAKAERLVTDGYRRLKVKIQPGHDTVPVTALRDGPAPASEVALHLDANGSYRGLDVSTLVDVAATGSVESLEQPLPPDDLAGAAELIRQLSRRALDRSQPAVVVGDEAVPSLDAAKHVADRGGLTGISIKPGRVGGLISARLLHDLCVQRGLAATAGGMIEAGLGRHALAALAALPGFTLTGDLSPAGRWLAADPWPDLDRVDGSITVPTSPGVSPPPDQAVLDRFTLDRRLIGHG